MTVVSLDSGRDAPVEARQLVRALCADARLDDEAALVCVSELVTNALRHGQPPVELSVEVEAEAEVIELRVSDGGGGQPTVGRPDQWSFTGRGLLLVSELAAEWGIDAPDGPEGPKTVWCRIRAARRPDPEVAPPPVAPVEPALERATIESVLLDTLLDQGGMGVVVFDHELRYLMVNSVAAEINGLPVTAHLGRRLDEVLPDIDASFTPVLRRVFDTGSQADGIEVTGQTPARPGVERSWVATCYPIETDAAIVGVAVVFAETTQLRQAERRLRSLIDGLFTFVGLLTPDGELLEANRAALDAADLAPEDVMGRPFWDAYWWAHDAAVQEQLRRAIERARSGEVVRYDVPVQVRDGHLITIDFQLVPLVEDGEVTYLVPSGLDVSDREDARRQAAAMAQLARGINGASSTDAISRLVSRQAAEAVGGVSAHLAVLDDTGRELRISGGAGPVPSGRSESWARAPLAGSSPMHTVLRTGRPELIVDRADRETRYPELVEASDRLGHGASAAMPLQRADGEVFGVLSIAWTPDAPPTGRTWDQLQALTDLVAQGLERTRLGAARSHLVGELQRELLPELPTIDGLALSYCYEPATDALGFGGDWVDVVRLDDDRTALVVGDIAGHGVEAAARMSQVQAVIGTLLRQGTDLGEIFFQAQTLLADRYPGFVATAVAAEIDQRRGLLRFVSAGHPPLLTREPTGEVEVREGGRQPLIGYISGPTDPASVSFAPGSTVVLYTDGLIEAPGRHIDDGIGDVVRALSEMPTDTEPEDVLGGLDDALIGPTHRRDDIAILVAQRRAETSSD